MAGDIFKEWMFLLWRTKDSSKSMLIFKANEENLRLTVSYGITHAL